jgi:flagellar biogenesis protein FliO
MSDLPSITLARRLQTMPVVPPISGLLPALLLVFVAASTGMADTAVSSTSTATLNTPLHDTGQSLLRVLGAFLVVITVFLAGVWLFRNWQRVALRHSAVARLNILEARSLGNRQLLFVVGYEQQRMLVGASPGGISLLAVLPEASETATERPIQAGFPAVLNGFLNRQQTR